MRVVVLSGGRSSEHDVSLRSGASVARGLEAAGHEVVAVTIERDGRWRCEAAPVELTPAAGLLDADAVFPALHGAFGEDGSVQGLLEWLDVPYVGSDVLASAICMDKLTPEAAVRRARASRRWTSSPWRGGLARALRGDGAAALGEAVAAGLQRRHQQGRGTRRTLTGGRAGPAPRPAGDRRGRGQRARGRVLGARQRVDAETSLPGEIVANAEWYDFEAKYSRAGWSCGCRRRSPRRAPSRCASWPRRPSPSPAAPASPAATSSSSPTATVLVNEINTMPGFTETSVYAKLLEASGVAYADLCDRLVNLAVERHRSARSHQF